MPATVRYDEQHCPIARALDVLGDRWTLLILRELTAGDRRFTDLRDALPGIAPTLLTQRLRTMAADGLLASKELPPPAARSVYTITPRGRETVPVLRALVRWGMPLLEEAGPDDVVRPWSAVSIALTAYFDPAMAAGIDERYRLEIDGQPFELSSVAGGGEPRAEADLALAMSAKTLLDIRQGRVTLPDAIASGAVRKTGTAKALANFTKVFRVDRPAVAR